MRRHLNHLLRAIDGGDPPAGEPLARQRYGHAMPAADLQHSIGWVERQGGHRPHEPFRGLTRHAYTQPFRTPRSPAMPPIATSGGYLAADLSRDIASRVQAPARRRYPGHLKLVPRARLIAST